MGEREAPFSSSFPNSWSQMRAHKKRCRLAAAGGTHKYAHHATLQRMCPLCPQYRIMHGKEGEVFLWNLYILLSFSFYETCSIVHLAVNTWNIIYHIDRVEDIQPT